MTEPYEAPLAFGRQLFVDALRRGDVAAACSVYEDDAVLLPPAAGRLHGRQEIREFWEAGLSSGIADVVLDTREIRADAGMVCEVGRYTLRIESGDAASVLERGHYVHIHRRQPDGSWLRSVEIFTPGGNE